MAKKKAKINPPEIADHYKSYIDTQEALMRLIRTSERGISMIRAMPNAVKAVAFYKGTIDDPKSTNEI